MNLRPWKSWIAFGGLVALAALAVIGHTHRAAAAPDWKAVEQAIGKSGQLLPGGVYRIGFPRTDLTVTVQGIRVEPAFALGSYAAFKPMGDQAMVMGDLVLRDEEVAPVMTRLLQGGLTVTAVHNHLNEMSPHVMYMHYGGHGDAVRLSAAIHDALSASATPLASAPAASSAAGGPSFDPKQIEAIMGRSGTLLNPRVFQVGVPRAETITEGGEELPPAMGIGMPFNFQDLGDGKAAITGDFVLIAREVNPVARALRSNGIEVTALHNHALGDEPRLFYMHFWAHDDALKLARGLRAALDLTNSRK
ncbi:MAG TPA: DUF1259 domain-containing protein [Methylomirabilota bacterium]|jgi:hypothetical protein|nr:DUF1259 domain-containing protein [Methylomirabilota bacterium]